MPPPLPRHFAWIESLHADLVLGRRMKTLARHFARLLPMHGSVLDVGCGNGIIAKLVMQARPGLLIEGIDIAERHECAIPMQVYDGGIFPFPDNSFDAVMFVDVLHHTVNPLAVLKEAARVTRDAIVVKDHFCKSRTAWYRLAFMDWIGNRPHDIVLPYNYWSPEQWSQAWTQLGTEPDLVITKLGLYPRFVRPLFEYGLHFVARLPIKTLTNDPNRRSR